MKAKISKDLVLFIILVPLLLWGAFYLSGRMENRLPDYAAANKSRTGLSVFYEALKDLDYPIDRTMEALNHEDTANVQIIAHGGSFDINSQETKTWIEKGGILVYLSPELVYLAPESTGAIDYGDEEKADGDITLYKYHKGLIIFSDALNVTNQTLTKDTNNAYALLKQIDQHPYKKIIFNESYLYSAGAHQSLWDYIAIEYKFIIYQLLLALALFFYYKGKRFGKPLPLYEEVERIENEYLYSAATLYRQAKCWDIMLDNYYKSLLKLAGCSHENLSSFWEREKLPSLNKAVKVHEFMQKEKPMLKETVQIIAVIEQLKYILTKRRDSYWKTLKRTT